VVLVRRIELVEEVIGCCGDKRWVFRNVFKGSCSRGFGHVDSHSSIQGG